MRTYKFRDFDLETNTIRYFDIDGYNREKHDCYGNMTQFTGLTDSEGKDIYEGDILRCEFWGGTVIWDEGEYLLFGPYCNDRLSTALKSDVFKIVNNIYNESTIR